MKSVHHRRGAIDPARVDDLLGAELYNLVEDIGETKNLSAAEPEKFQELAAAWREWNREMAKPLWYPARLTPALP